MGRLQEMKTEDLGMSEQVTSGAVEDLARLLAEGLDLCVRAREIDAGFRRAATLACSSDPEAWQADGTFGRHVARNNIENPHAPISTRSATPYLWVQDQYDRDLADWEKRARATLATWKAT